MSKRAHPLIAVLSALVMLVSSGVSWSAGRAELDALHEALGTEQLLVIMREEGLEQAEALRTEMLPPGRGGAIWSGVAAAIYDVPGMSQSFRLGFDAALEGEDVGPLVDFFTSEPGRRIVQLELEARRAIMAPEVEEAARAAFAQLERSDTERAALLERFVAENDLIEYNVMGAMNSSLAFMQGLAEGEGFEMGEADILSDVWSREAEIREDTSGWIFAYLALAYEPLGDDELDIYIALSRSEAGRALNRALFAGFDRVFNEVSVALGRAVSRFAVGEEL
jgi:hypothetical protein